MMSLRTQLYWVVKSYTTRKTLLFFVGYYLLLAIPLGLGAIFEGRAPSVPILPFYAQAALVGALWLQFRAQTVTTVGSVAPRFWLSHQIVLAGAAVLTSGFQALAMIAMNTDALAAWAVSGLLYVPWAMLQVPYDRLSSDRAGAATQRTNTGVVIFGVLCFLLLSLSQAFLPDQIIRRFLAGEYPRVAFAFFVADIMALSIIVMRMPMHHRVMRESSNLLPPCEVTWGSWTEWNIKNQNTAKPHRSDHRFDAVTPGVARENDRMRTRLLRQANAMTGRNLLYFTMMLSVGMWVMLSALSFYLTGDLNWRLRGLKMTMFLISYLKPVMMLFIQWDQRRRMFEIELLRPIVRPQLFRDLAFAVLVDAGVIAAVHAANIAVWILVFGQPFQVTAAVVVLAAASIGLMPASVLVLLTYPQNHHAFVFIVIAFMMFVVMEIALIAALFSTADEGTPAASARIIAFAAVVLLAAFAITARKRWQTLEWDV